MAKRVAKKKTTKKKATAKKATTTRKKTAAATAGKPRTKSEIFRMIAEDTGLARKDVVSVFESMNTVMEKDLGRRGPGVFTVPGLIKVRVVKKAAVKARKGVNPFTGEEMMFKAKPARKVVKAQPLKALKDMVN